MSCLLGKSFWNVTLPISAFPVWSCGPKSPLRRAIFDSRGVYFKWFCSICYLLIRPLFCRVVRLQAELEELVKREHARIDSQDKSSESKEAAAKSSTTDEASEPRKEEWLSKTPLLKGVVMSQLEPVLREILIPGILFGSSEDSHPHPFFLYCSYQLIALCWHESPSLSLLYIF